MYRIRSIFNFVGSEKLHGDTNSSLVSHLAKAEF